MRAVVTGASGGLGYETALALAGSGHEVVLTARNPAKGDLALHRIRAAWPAARVSFAVLDMASLASVAAFAAGVVGPVGLLVNNAGVMAPDRRQVTPDGFELQMGTNYFGHFTLTARLLPRLIEGRARVVQVSSLAHRHARIDFDDLQGERRYRPWTQYGQSKLAMLMFALELDRRARAAGWPIVSVAAHLACGRRRCTPPSACSANPPPRVRARSCMPASRWVSRAVRTGAHPDAAKSAAPLPPPASCHRRRTRPRRHGCGRFRRGWLGLVGP